MEIIQEIGSYAGIAAVVGLAVLSVLYFSQARDVRRLREWAGRAPERAPQPVQAQPAQPQRVVAQPVPKPGTAVAGRPIPPPVPRPPGAQPGVVARPVPAQPLATGAAPAVAKGPAAATPAAAKATQPADSEAATANGDHDEDDPTTDATGLDTAEHSAPAPPGAADEHGEDLHDSDDADLDEEYELDGESAEHDALEADSDDAGDEHDEQGEHAEDDLVDEDEPEGDHETDPEAPSSSVGEETGEWDPLETGEWRPEDEHSDFDFTDEHDIAPATPAPVPPRPPEPLVPSLPRRATPVPSARGAQPGGGPILPPYAESRPGPESRQASPGGRRLLVAIGVVLLLVVGVFGVTRVIGGDEDPAPPAADQPVSEPIDNTPAEDEADQQPPIDPSTVTVAVLNGTTVGGLAAEKGSEVTAAGFNLGTVANDADQERAESVVMFAPGAEREAEEVARELGVNQREEIDAATRALAGDATVTFIVGADQTQ